LNAPFQLPDDPAIDEAATVNLRLLDRDIEEFHADGFRYDEISILLSTNLTVGSSVAT
jgi:hypothetical protein